MIFKSQMFQRGICLIRRYIIAIAVLPFVFNNLSFAATLNDVVKQQDDLRIQEKERQNAVEESIQRTPNQLKNPDKLSYQNPIEGETPCFDIKTITLTGKDSEKFQWLTNNLESFTTTCLGVKSVQALQLNLNNRLLAAGYATSRVSLPNQKMSSGELKLDLHVGYIDSFRLEDSKELDWFTMPWATWRNAVPISEGDILNIRDLDQGLEQLKRLPSQEVEIVIEPADQENSSTLVIKRQQERRVRGQLSLDNAGSSSLGREHGQFGLSVDAPLGLNDQLYLNLGSNINHASEDHRNQSASAYYSIPFGYNTFSTSYNYSRFGQIVQGTTVQFLSSGYSQNLEAKLHRTVMRDATSKLGVFGAISTRRAHSYLDDVELVVQQRQNTAVELGITYTKKWQSTNLNLELSNSRGVSWFQAEPRFFEVSDFEQPTTRPNIWRGNVELSFAIPYWDNTLRYNTRLQWQTSPKMALSLDQFSIGSRYSVRGFDGDVILQGESGYSLRNELTMRGFGVANDQLYIAPYIALDVGHIWGPSVNGSPYNTLAGVAFGLTAQSKYLSADIALGTPLYKPDGFETHSINPMLQLSISI